MIKKALRTKPVYKFYFHYKNYKFNNFQISSTFRKKKWVNLKNINSINQQQPIYLCHFRKLNIKRFYYYKFNNKQFLKKYLVNYKEYNFKYQIYKNFQLIERRLDYNLYKAKFIPSLYAAHFYITNGYIFVNHKCIKNCNYLLHTHDIITVHSKIYSICQQNLINTVFLKNKTLYYIQNLEIDFTTCSFVFLNKQNFNLLKLDNQIKKVDFISKKNNYDLKNNYFQFFDYIFNYYLFCNVKTKSQNVNLQSINLIIKFLCFYFNDYFFRNLLLKQAFIFKYNYLICFLQNYKILSFQSLLHLFTSEKTSKFNNNLAYTFFHYNWNIIFNFYIYSLQTLNFINFQYTKNSVSTYQIQLLFNKTFFQLLKTKLQIIKYFAKLAPFNEQNKSKLKPYKILNYSTVRRFETSSIKFLSFNKYKQLLLYISSRQFKYKIYRKCTSFQQNDYKRQRLISSCRRALTYAYFNQIKCQSNYNDATKHELYNQLRVIPTIKGSINNKFLTKQIYYPKQSLEYASLYNSAILGLTTLQKQLIQLVKQFKLLLEITKINQKQIEIYLTNLQKRMNFFNSTSNFINLNYNRYYKSLYLLNFVINEKFNMALSSAINLKLPNLVFYKLHLKAIYTRKVRTTIKQQHYRYSQFNCQRYKISYIYIPYKKKRLLFSTFEQKYFKKQIIFSLHIFSKKYLTTLLQLKKNKKKVDIINNNFYYNLSHEIFQSNCMIITNKNQFNDKYFFLDLIVNLSIRKLNEIYNRFDITYKIIKQQQPKTIQVCLSKKKQIKYAKYSKKYIYLKKIQKFHYCQKLYFLHIKKYVQFKNTVMFIQYKSHIKFINQFNMLYTYYTIYIRKYKILKYLYNNYLWKEYTNFNDQILNRFKLKNYNLNYIKMLYFNLLFTKLINISKFDYICSTNYKYNCKFNLLINYFILIKRFYY